MKKFLIIGNSNAITQKNIFPHIASGEWLMRSSNNKIHLSMDFIDCDGNIKNIPSAWFTNIGIPSTNTLTLSKKYNPNDYPKYDNIDAINVNRIKDIPMDYDGCMAVPISIVLFTNQFEIVGALPRGGPINGHFTYKRVLVKKKKG